jgi:uncharacterized membrane protein
MFLATALAVGPLVVFTSILRTGDAHVIRRAFPLAEPIARAGGVMYGLGIVFGIIAALAGSIDLTARWLLAAYALVVPLGINGLYAERWMRDVATAAHEDNSSQLAVWRRSRVPFVSVSVAVILTLAIVYVMVVKPILW